MGSTEPLLWLHWSPASPSVRSHRQFSRPLSSKLLAGKLVLQVGFPGNLTCSTNPQHLRCSQAHFLSAIGLSQVLKIAENTFKYVTKYYFSISCWCAIYFVLRKLSLKGYIFSDKNQEREKLKSIIKNWKIRSKSCCQSPHAIIYLNSEHFNTNQNSHSSSCLSLTEIHLPRKKTGTPSDLWCFD